MLICTRQKLAFLAVPKTGSTSYHAALSRLSDGIIAAAPEDKHMTYRRFTKVMQPQITGQYGPGFEAMAILRDPLERLRSWYRYRRRLEPASVRSTRSFSFEEFVAQSLLPRPPAFAAIGNQRRFVSDTKGRVGVTHLFAIESPKAIEAFLTERFGTLPRIGRLNVSDPAPTHLPDTIEARLRSARAAEFALHRAVIEAGGYLRTS